MRKCLFFSILFCFLLCYAEEVLSQAEVLSQDTTIRMYAEEMPRFPGCEVADSSLAFRQTCAEAALFNYLYTHLMYPPEAREQELEGTVVASLVINTDGSIGDVAIVRDIGGGCGEEVLRVLRLMQAEGIRWRPGYQAGEAVRVRVNIPVRFVLEEALPYALVNGDTIYVEIDSLPHFRGGEEALTRFLRERLAYPPLDKDTCILGDMNVEILIGADGQVRVLNVMDYHGLGFDYQFEAIRVATATYGYWSPAIYQGRAVPTSYMLYFFFEPQGEQCVAYKQSYEKARQWADEGLKLFNEGERESGLQLLTEAINAFPNNANFRYTRAEMYLSMEQIEKACEDFSIVRENVVLPLVEQLYPLICR